MSGRTSSAWSQRMEDYLHAHHPNPVWREELLAIAMDLIPPGRAFRVWDHQLDWLAKRSGSNPVKNRQPTDQSIRRGQRYLAQQALIGLRHRGLIVIQTDEDGRDWVSLGRPRRQPTPEEYSAWAQRAANSRTPEDRRRSALKAAATLGRQRSSRIRKIAAARLTPEQHRERTLKGWETRRAHQAERDARDRRHADGGLSEQEGREVE